MAALDAEDTAQGGKEFLIKAKDRGFEGFSKDEEGQWDGPFCFLQAADTQFGMIDSYVYHKTDVTWDAEIELTKQAVAAANAMSPKPRFFIVCGDLVDAFPGDPKKGPQESDYKQVFCDLDPDIPLVCVCGNHDIGNTPTRESVRGYRNSFGDDYFSFWVGGVKFIVLNSQFYEDPSKVMDLKEEQDQWLETELAEASTSRCHHLVVFQHIPWFLNEPDEPKDYFNIDMPLRKHMLDKFRNAGVKTIFCGHYHRNAGGFYGDMELVVTSAIGAQLGKDKSGMRVVRVKDRDILHDYYDLDNVPKVVNLS